MPELANGVLEYLGKGDFQNRTHVVEGLESAKTAVNMLFTGENTGKLIVKL